MKNYLGISKTKYNSSVCLIPNQNLEFLQIWQTERLTRKKDSRAWPTIALKQLNESLKDKIDQAFQIAENRDVELPKFFEDFLDLQYPFYDFIQKNNLENYTSKQNDKIEFVGHHEAHAYSALFMSPFEKSIIVVRDGAGNKRKDILDGVETLNTLDDLEECSIYLQNGSNLKLVNKKWIKLSCGIKNPEHLFSEGIGLSYEKIAEFIFNNPSSTGKVMGLSAFGDAANIENRFGFLDSLDWQKKFSGDTKKSWEESSSYKLYCDLAATIQKSFEQESLELFKNLKSEFPDYQNLILTGGCALNCSSNGKLYRENIFKKIYVLPFPGDESISLGLACKKYYSENLWSAFKNENQHAYWGPIASIPNSDELKTLLKFNNVKFEEVLNVSEAASKDLISGLVIGWFQGRSESGPRALGNRSILCRADKVGIKNYLNSKIKFRESFRPYGCTTLFEYSDEYFEVESDFENPFMSFAVPIKLAYRSILKEVSHIDGTSRMQTLRKSQNPLFYDLIKKFGDQSGLYCVLNTSLNIMGEPIVETMADAVHFFLNAPVDSMYIGNIKLLRQ